MELRGQARSQMEFTAIPQEGGRMRQKKSLEEGQASSQEEDEYDLNNQAEVIFHPGRDL